VVESLLNCHSTDVNSLDNCKITPMMRAAVGGHIDAVRYLR
jgi:hypothetical protein